MHPGIQVSSEEKVKNIFVDLDETLIHTDSTDGGMPNEIEPVSLKIDYTNYIVSLRPGANDLLFALRSVGNVFMLTRATHDYALAMNKEFNLAFPPNRIYSRRDVNHYRYKELHLPKGRNYLIDDLSQRDNYEKVALIAQLGPVHYIQVEAFYGFKAQALTKSSIQNIVDLVQKE